jgi:hypothetical protein
MQFECSEEEVVRIVRRREGYSLWKAYWKSPLSKGLIIVTTILLFGSIVLAELGFSNWVHQPPLIAACILYGVLVKRLFATCKRDARSLLLEIVNDNHKTNVWETNKSG